MKLWEAIRELEHNPNKQFKSIDIITGDICILMVSENGYLYFNKYDKQGKLHEERAPRGKFNGNVDIHGIWEEVIKDKKVSFMEAFEAYKTGNDIYCLIDKVNDKVVYDGIFSEDETFNAWDIAYGEWYIKEGV